MNQVEWDNDVDSGSGEEDIGRAKAKPTSGVYVYRPGQSNSEVVWVRQWDDLSDFIGLDELTVVGFTAKWNSSGNAAMQEFDRLSVEMDPDVALAVDVDQMQSVPREIKAIYQNVPAFRFYRLGQVLGSLDDCTDPRKLTDMWRRLHAQTSALNAQLSIGSGGGGGGGGSGSDSDDDNGPRRPQQPQVFYSGPIQVSETRTVTQTKKKDPFSSFMKSVEREVNKFDNTTVRNNSNSSSSGNNSRPNTEVRRAQPQQQQQQHQQQPQRQQQTQQTYGQTSPRQTQPQQQQGVYSQQPQQFQYQASQPQTVQQSQTTSEKRGGLAGVFGGKKETTTTTTTTRNGGAEELEEKMRTELQKLGIFGNSNSSSSSNQPRAQPRAQPQQQQQPPQQPQRTFVPPQAPAPEPVPARTVAAAPVPMPEYLRPVQRPPLLPDPPSLSKDRYTYLECDCMMGNVKYFLQVALTSVQIIRDHGLELTAEHQALVLRRIAGAAKEIKTLVSVLQRVDTRVAHTLSKQDALMAASKRMVELTVALVSLCQRIAKGEESPESFEDGFKSYLEGCGELTQCVRMLNFDANAREFKMRLGSV